jgi:peptidoglycan/LPS O-acetylase OafA/YrhL
MPRIGLNVLFIVLYLGNWVVTFGRSIGVLSLGITWSLGVEEQFYAFWPILLAFLLRRGRPAITVGVMIGLSAVAVVSRILLWSAHLHWDAVYSQTEARFDALMIGALLAYGLHRGWQPGRWVRAAGWFGGLFLGLILISIPVGTGWLLQGGFTAVAIAAGALLLALLDERWWLTKLLSTRPFVAVGRRSYTLYLWHMLVFVAVFRLAPLNGPVHLLSVLIALPLVTTLSYRFVEQPFLRLKGRGGGTRGAPRAMELEVQAPGAAVPSEVQVTN